MLQYTVSKLYRDANGNVWRHLAEPNAFLVCWALEDTSRDQRPSHELWHGGRGETKRGEVFPVEPLIEEQSMKTYRVFLTRRTEYEYHVEANSEEEAIELASRLAYEHKIQSVDETPIDGVTEAYAKLAIEERKS